MKRFFFLILWIVMSVSVYSQVLLIYGGEKHDVFLGTLNESPFSSRSIWNDFGQYGNGFNSNCIWNEFGKYGNDFSSYCPWNDYASTPPVLVDKDGNYYGKFNSSNKNALVRNICKMAPSIVKGKIKLDEAYKLLFDK